MRCRRRLPGAGAPREAGRRTRCADDLLLLLDRGRLPVVRDLVTELAEERRRHGVLDERPQLSAVGRTAEEPDGDTKPPLVAPASTVRAPLVVHADRL